jgi:hypothetical protein
MSETQKPNEKPLEKAQEPTTAAVDKPLVDRIMAVVEDVMKAKLDTFEKKIDEKIDVILKSKEVEVEQALRKGFGLEQDPVIHMSDLVKYGRKIGLENSESGKKTPAALEKAGPEGTGKIENPIDAQLKAFGINLEAKP